MSEYEIARLERIKENEKMLEQLFPEGTDVLTPKTLYRTRKRRRQTTGTSTSDYSSEQSYSDDDDSGSYHVR